MPRQRSARPLPPEFPHAMFLSYSPEYCDASDQDARNRLCSKRMQNVTYFCCSLAPAESAGTRWKYMAPARTSDFAGLSGDMDAKTLYGLIQGSSSRTNALRARRA